MTRLLALTFATFTATTALSQELVDKGFVEGWNIMMDPALGNGCLIQTVYQDLSVVRLGYDALGNRGYFAVYNKAWGDIKQGESYPIRFDLDGKSYDATAIGFNERDVPGATVFFTDRSFVNAIAQNKTMTVYNPAGEVVMAIDLKGTAKALDYARDCQNKKL
ncbi:MULTISPECIES: hypothetical protein [unclassified Ruegeria]|uniref:hypothetical protein n=1 Tax=unclassified Ruegeria TaxID=2625375 RepID=UPI00148914DA|nr:MULTISPECIES: hypothetical protein [unclassified Ruegeria]NOD32956.1 hypothetical protein [Ruegeria sp. HKCCD7296]NOD49133.1 hypothetical protein [Ruegeria sp. HKCCD5849]NOD51697.1 hypothetical protein [Ruegeria sp. HKCCD5851]NOD68683.1 hypothetical protein [Ruegeria sp. HKCCD7303]NOE34958.1 hypothetical protein [Ruegeria sp. HKCCD7318]